MTHKSGVELWEDRYQPLPQAIIRTPFRSIYEAMWEAETKFDLLFRRDHRVYVWAANRVQIYYKLAAATGIYDAAKTIVAKRDEPEEIFVESLPQVDVYVQTGALGPATANRSRPYGCLYTQDYVHWLLDHNRSVLLLHDRAEDLIDHPNLHPLHSRQLQTFASHYRHLAPKKEQCVLDQKRLAFWAKVDDFLYERLGARILGADQIQKWIHGFLSQIVTQRALFGQVRPKAFICMAHYFRAPQIRAAREVGARTIDFQHGINSMFHAGYGFPAIRTEARRIPYFPEEFWAWGSGWASKDWFPETACDIRVLGHHFQAEYRKNSSVPTRPDKTLMIATSWAMQTAFKIAAANIAARLPDWTIILKLHPREEVADYQSLVEDHANICIIAGDKDVVEAAREVSVVLSICSSSLFDVLLVGAPIMVLFSEGAEYAEEFVSRYDVPLVEMDASNIADCLARAARQSIPLNEVFSSGRKQRIDLAMLSVMGELPPRYVRVEPSPPLRTGIQARLSALAASLATLLSPEQRLRQLAGLTPNAFLASGPAPAWCGVSVTGAATQRFWNLVFRRYWQDQPGEFRAFLLEAIDYIRESGNHDIIQAALLSLIQMGAKPTASYRREYLALLYRMKRRGRHEAFKKGLAILIEGALSESPYAALPLYEHAVNERSEQVFHELYGIKRKERHWKEGAALLALQSPLLASVVATLERMAGASDNEYLDSRVSQTDIVELSLYLRRRIEEGRPFAMMRLGDGEVYGMDPSDYLDARTLEEDRAVREEIWWGRKIDEELRARLRADFMEALPLCDLIGLPSSFRLLRDLPGAIKSMRRPMEYWIRTARAHVILFRELERMMDDGRLDLSGKALCDDRCHQDLFTPDRLRILLEGVKHVVCVNCFSREQLNKGLGDEIINDHVLTPPHRKVRDHVPDSPLRDVAMPSALDELLAGIDETVRPGSVVLVAGGFAGKLLIARAKERGGVVFDIGASADYWVGVDTRGELDFTAYR